MNVCVRLTVLVINSCCIVTYQEHSTACRCTAVPVANYSENFIVLLTTLFKHWQISKHLIRLYGIKTKYLMTKSKFGLSTNYSNLEQLNSKHVRVVQYDCCTRRISKLVLWSDHYQQVSDHLVPLVVATCHCAVPWHCQQTVSSMWPINCWCEGVTLVYMNNKLMEDYGSHRNSAIRMRDNACHSSIGWQLDHLESEIALLYMYGLWVCALGTDEPD